MDPQGGGGSAGENYRLGWEEIRGFEGGGEGERGMRSGGEGQMGIERVEG